jgi:hypothetical protein
MTVTTHDVQEAYITLISNNLTDPNTERKAKGTKWVYGDLPASTMGSNYYPRVSVMDISAPVEAHEIGANTERVNAVIEVQVRMHKNLKFNGVEAPSSVSTLAVNVSDLIRSGTAKEYLLTNCGVFLTRLTVDDATQVDDLIIKRLVFKNILRR